MGEPTSQQPASDFNPPKAPRRPAVFPPGSTGAGNATQSTNDSLIPLAALALMPPESVVPLAVQSAVQSPASSAVQSPAATTPVDLSPAELPPSPVLPPAASPEVPAPTPPSAAAAPPTPPAGPPPLPLAPAPLPVLPINYVDLGSITGPPPSWAAIGTLSLVIGGVGVIVNVLLAVFWIHNCIGSYFPSAGYVPPIPASTLTPYTDELVAARGLSRAERTPIEKDFNLTAPEDEDRLAMLDRLLAEYGKDILPLNEPLNVRPIDEAFADRDHPVSRPKVFTVNGQHVTLSSDTAICGVTTNPMIVYETTTAPPHPDGVYEKLPPRFTTFAIDEEIKRLAAANPRLTPAQLATIADLAMSTSPVTDRSTVPPRPAVAASPPTADGLVEARVGTRRYYVLKDGRSVPSEQAIYGIELPRGAIVSSQKNVVPAWPGSPTLMLATAVHALAGAGAGVMLFVAAILLLKDRPSGARLHYQWGHLKSVLMLVELVLGCFYLYSVSNDNSARAHFDVVSGIAGLSLSLAIQPVYLITVLVVMRGQPTKNFLASRGTSLMLWDAQGWAVVMRWISTSRWMSMGKVIGYAFLSVAGLHLVAAVWVSASGEWGTLSVHGIAMTVLALLGVTCIRLRKLLPKPALTAAMIAMIAMMSAATVSRGQTTQPTSKPARSAADQAVYDQVATELKAVTPRSPDRAKVIQGIADQGLPAVEPLMDFLASPRATDTDAATAAAAWTDAAVAENPEFRKALLAYIPQMRPVRYIPRGMAVFSVISDDPGLLPYWIAVCSSNEGVLAQKAFKNALAIDPKGAALIAAIKERLHNGKDFNSHNYCFATLYKLSDTGRDALLELLRDPNAEVRMHTIRYLSYHQMPEKDAIPPDAIIDFVENPTRGIDKTLTKTVPTDGEYRERAINALWMLDRPKDERLLGLLGSTQLPDDASQAAVLYCLGEDFPSLRPLIEPHRASEQWPMIKRIVTTVVENPTDGSALVAQLTKSTDRAEQRLIVRVIAERNTPADLSPAVLFSHIDADDPALRDAMFKLLHGSAAIAESEPMVNWVVRQFHADSDGGATLIKRLADDPPNGRGLLLRLCGDDRLSRDQVNRVFRFFAIQHQRMGIVGQALFDTDPWNAQSQATACEITRRTAAGMDLLSTEFKLLEIGSPAQKALIAEDLRRQKVNGPATRVRLEKVLNARLTSAVPAPAVTLAPVQFPAAAVTQDLPYTAIAWMGTAVAFLLFAAVGVAAMISAFARMPR